MELETSIPGGYDNFRSLGLGHGAIVFITKDADCASVPTGLTDNVRDDWWVGGTSGVDTAYEVAYKDWLAMAKAGDPDKYGDFPSSLASNNVAGMVFSDGEMVCWQDGYVSPKLRIIDLRSRSETSSVEIGTCNWNADGETDRIGTVKLLSFVDSDANIHDGEINIPTANWDGEGSGTNRTGVIRSITLTTGQQTSATILNGDIQISVDSISQTPPTCNWNADGEPDRTGTVKSISFVDAEAYIKEGAVFLPTGDSATMRAGVVYDIQETTGIDNPVIENGIIKYPKWEFAEEWFIVSGHDVSINTASLEAMASSIVDKIGVNVEVSGVVEYLTDPSMNNAFVQFDASSTAYAASNSDLDNLGIDTNVTTARPTT